MSSAGVDPELRDRVYARVGTSLRSKYTLDGVLGIGGMAAVYQATHRNGRRVAVKLLHPELMLSGGAKARFLREGLVANKVHHPGVVTVLDDDTNEDGAAFIVMELLEGATLEELWEKHANRLPLPAVVAVGVMLLDILSAAHAAGVVHRDIKPGNLFLTHGWQLKILDFGISRLQEIRSSTSTQDGMALGSPAFMAPEQALGRVNEIDGRTDLWATAAALYTLATGAFVHHGQTGQEMLIRAATTPVIPFSQKMPEAPAAVAAVLDRALAFDRGARWETASEMGAALAEAARASFGEEPSAGTFAALLPFVPAAVPPVLPARVSAMHASGGATEITSTTSGSMRTDRGKKRLYVLGGVGLLGAIVGVAALASFASRGTSPSPPGSTDPRTAGGPVAAVATSASPIPPVAAVSASAPSPSPPEAQPVASTARDPGTSPSRGASSGHSSGTGKGSRPAAPPAKPTGFLPPPPPAPANDPCNPPFRYDFFGNKVPKPGCAAP